MSQRRGFRGGRRGGGGRNGRFSGRGVGGRTQNSGVGHPGDDAIEVPQGVECAIIPVAYKQQGELSDCLDAARAVKEELAKAGINTWTDMRRSLKPCDKFQFWEGRRIHVWIEIGKKEVAAQSVLVADLVNKVRHPNGRMIAKKSTVHTDNVVARIQEIIKEGKAKPPERKRAFDQTEDEGAPSKWAAVLDLIDEDAPPETLLSAAKAAHGGNKKSKKVKSDKEFPTKNARQQQPVKQDTVDMPAKAEITAEEKQAKKLKLKNKKKSKKTSVTQEVTSKSE
eukprot:m.199063 g.199063  ORF g.199063 m.199063 type:complete len:281 (-) comp18773_c0_seq4:52-894(-)